MHSSAPAFPLYTKQALCWIVYIICKDSINYSFVRSYAVTLLLSDYLFAELQNYNNTEYDKLGLDPAIVIA